MVGLIVRAWGDARPDQIQEYTNRGFSHVYNLEYDDAAKVFQTLIDVAPEDPSGYCYQATNLWLRELVKGRELGLENFTSASYLNKTQKRKVDPTFERQFKEFSRQALEKAEQQLQKNPQDVRALYFLGTAYGIIASYEKTINRSTTAAIANGRKCVNYHRQVLKLDPNYYDSYLSIGLYEYITGVAHWSYRWIIRLAGHRGDKQRGLDMLSVVAEKGTNNRNDARVLLAVLSVWEMNFDASLYYMQQLHQQFPKNYLLELDTGALYRLLKKDEEAIRLYENILRKIKSKAPHYDRLGAEHVHYRLGMIYLDQKNPQPAIEHFTAVTRLTTGSEESATLSHLKLGKAYDLLNNRTKAQEQYKIVLAREDVKNSQDQARKYLRRPYLGGND